MQFDLIEFNRIRYGRGKEAARVRVWDGELTHLLWMSGQDIKANVIEHGPHLGLVLAAMEYAGALPATAISVDPALDTPPACSASPVAASRRLNSSRCSACSPFGTC